MTKEYKCTRFAAIALMAVLASTVLAEEEFFTPRKDLDGLRKNSETNAALPNVLILGDSISIGYTPSVIELLKDVANVQRPDANCGSTVSGKKKYRCLAGGHKMGRDSF